MGIKQLTDRNAVLEAIKIFDQLGREGFLVRYGFGKATKYFLIYNGRRYDSKAISGVAYGFQYPEHGPLSRSEFHGGENKVVLCLERMGFEVSRLDGIS